ncbi:MAG: 50S ribosomal protein L21, partial [Anaerolineales bacterium]
MRYAVLVAGGKQYIAREGETIEVDRMQLDVGQTAAFDQVLLVADGEDVRVGNPTVSGAKVKGKVLAQVKSPKVLVFKYKPKVRYRRKQGHR